MSKQDVKDSVVSRARDVLTRSSVLSSRDPNPERLLGDLCIHQNDKQGAEEHWKRAFARATDAQQKSELLEHFRQMRQGGGE